MILFDTEMARDIIFRQVCNIWHVICNFYLANTSFHEDIELLYIKIIGIIEFLIRGFLLFHSQS